MDQDLLDALERTSLTLDPVDQLVKALEKLTLAKTSPAFKAPTFGGEKF